MKKAHSEELRVQQCAALVLTGLILYVPANILPVLTITITGEIEPLTVLGGVDELVDSGLWPLGAVVFIASIVVPLCKLAGLIWLLLLHGSHSFRRQRTVVHRIIHSIGSWSMIDVFLLSVLVAVGQLGVLASVRAEQGAFYFSAVLICTLFATSRYEPWLIWEADERKRRKK